MFYVFSLELKNGKTIFGKTNGFTIFGKILRKTISILSCSKFFKKIKNGFTNSIKFEW